MRISDWSSDVCSSDLKILPVDRLCQCRCHVGLLHGPYVPLLNKSQYFIRKDTLARALDRGHHPPGELRYWSVARQEAYADAATSLEADKRAGIQIGRAHV